MLKATEIQWDVDKPEIYERLDEMNPKDAAQHLGIPYSRYHRLTTREKHDCASNIFHHNPAVLNEFMGLPNEINIPKELTDTEDISDWLSDTYGFCHKGFHLQGD